MVVISTDSPVAQLVEQLAVNQFVGSSSLPGGAQTIEAACSVNAGLWKGEPTHWGERK